MKSVLVYNQMPEFLIERLRYHLNVSYFQEITEENRNDFEVQLQNTDVLIGTGFPIEKELLKRAPKLQYVGNISAGYDNFNLKAMTQHGVMAVNAPNALTDTTADLIFGLLLSAARRITELDRYVRNGNWNEGIGKEFFGQNVHHKTIGIIGMGRIGRAVAKRAKLGFDMTVLYNKRTRDYETENNLGAQYRKLTDLLTEADYVCLTLPLAEDTYHLIDTPQFDLMKNSAVIVNGGRGPLIHEESLIHALNHQKIAAAGLDVFEEEPLPQTSPLISMNQVVLSPHIGSATEETRTGMAAEAVENLLQAVKGMQPNNLLNPEVYHGNK